MSKQAQLRKQGTYALIDTETSFHDEVFSIGVVIFKGDSFKPLSKHYFVLTPCCQHSGMYQDRLYDYGLEIMVKKGRRQTVEDLHMIFAHFWVEGLFAYNAHFDFNHLPELHDYPWYDVMGLASFRQYNPKVEELGLACLRNGRIKKGYRVDDILRMLKNDPCYSEMHHALKDAEDELEIMALLGHPIEAYEKTSIN